MLFQGLDLSCRRGGEVVFENVSFGLDAGAVLVLRGRNGAGKTSLLKIAALLLAPAAGVLQWDGKDVADDPDQQRRRIALVSHLDAVKGALSVAENLQQWQHLFGGEPERLASALTAFHISHLAETPARYLSAGQRKRVALARLLLSERPLWLLDEPTVSLDDDGIACLQAALAAHRQYCGMALIATHAPLDLPDAQDLTLGAAS